MSNIELKNTEVEPKSDVKKELPFIQCQRFIPGKHSEDADSTEGLIVELSENGALSPELVPKFIMSMDIAKLPNGRTTIVSARCRNNFIITETISAPSPDTYDEQAAIEICRSKIYSRLWEMLQFLFATASVTTNTIMEEFKAAQQIPEDIDKESVSKDD